MKARPHDTKPHGLPIRMANLAVPASSEQQADALQPTLADSLTDIATGGPFRRAVVSLFSSGRPRNSKLLIGNVDAVLHQGEMLLIAGPPTANASTLLRALSCSADLPLSETSLLDFGLLPPSRFARGTPFSPASENGSLRSELVFMNEHDAHFATLSLADTLMPAARAKTPRVRDAGTSRKAWARAEFEGVVESVQLTHAVGTSVGSPAVRGLSGGERKRASVAEALIARASVLLLDHPTSGLDSSTALSLLSLLKSGAVAGKRTVVVTAPSLSDSLYDQFDKILVLSSRGRQVYYGPTEDAERYFGALGLGFKRRTSAGEGVVEFLVGCIEGRENDVELERAWAKSQERQQLLVEMTAYEDRYLFANCAGPLEAAVRADKSSWTRKSSHYTVAFASQIAILTVRQYNLIRSELSTYWTKTIVNLLLSVLVGTLFYQLPPTTSAAFTRGSLLFLSVMFNCYLALAELGKTLEGRDIVRRQSDWGFFSASALAIARVAGDLPLIGAQVLLFGTITYFLTGLQRTIEHFAIYILFIYATALNLSSMFRMFAALSPNFDVAIRYCGVALNILVVFAGYFIPTPSMRPWLRWIHYVVDPVSYAYEAVLSNEFRDLTLACSPSDIVPSGPSYTNASYQTCLLPGSSPGSLSVSGSAYLAYAYSFHHTPWRNLGIILAQALAFLTVGVVATEFFHFAPAGQVRLWSRTGRVMKRLKGKWYKGYGDLEDALGGVGVTMEVGEDDAEESRPELKWKDISLWVDTPLETRRLLDRISGFIVPGQTCVMMGKTGAGKSTRTIHSSSQPELKILTFALPAVLNVLAGRLDGVVKGSITVDGRAPTDEFYRTTGYVEQFDLHDEQSTVREALEFSALLRQDSRIPRSEKLAYVDTVLDLLNLTHLQDAIIGTPAAGLSLEQRKKVTIAVEVVAKPDILFCDEPTTGLDTKSALRVVGLLRRLAKTGLAVIATAETFAVFDNVLLLQRGGKQVYFGPRSDAVSFFATEKSSDYANPADFLLDAAGAGSDVPDEDLSQVDGLDVLSARWKASSHYLTLQSTLVTLSAPSTPIAKPPTRSATRLRQCIELTRRVSRNYSRDLAYSYTKFFTATIVSLIIGLSFLQLGNSVVSMQNRLFSVFLILFVPPVFMNLGIFKMVKMRALWHARERPSKVYGRTAFVTSLLLSEMPYSIACATLFFCIWYFLVGLPLVASTIGYSFVMIQLFFQFQATWAMWITALAPSLGAIANLLPFFLVSMEAFNGYLVDPASRALCEFCKVSTGDDFLKELNISFNDRWMGMGVFAAYTFTNFVLVYLFSYFPPRLPSWQSSRSRMRVEQVAAEAMAKESAEAGEVRLADGALDAFT
ncbi:hypothetical protein RQP46_004772 [Phenoliferia psychrophenolica]